MEDAGNLISPAEAPCVPEPRSEGAGQDGLDARRRHAGVVRSMVALSLVFGAQNLVDLYRRIVGPVGNPLEAQRASAAWFHPFRPRTRRIGIGLRVKRRLQAGAR